MIMTLKGVVLDTTGNKMTLKGAVLHTTDNVSDFETRYLTVCSPCQKPSPTRTFT